MRRLVVVATTLTTLLMAHPATANPAAVRLSGALRCLAAGGAHISLTIENVGPRRVVIDQDFHLQVNVTRPGPDVGMIAFVFPAPGWARIPPGGSRTFELDLGEGFEGEPGTDLSGLRLHLEAVVFFVNRPHPAVKTFSFPACAPPAA